jgi:hypothetical protein
MSGIGMRRRSRNAPNRDTVMEIRDVIARETSGYRPGGLRCDFDRLSEDDQRKVIDLVREAGKGGGWSWTKLSKKDRTTLEKLIERAADTPGLFKQTRDMEEIAALAAEAHVAAVRRPLSRKQEHGIFAELARQVEDGHLHAPHVALIALVLTIYTSGRALGPRSRVESLADGEPVLIVDAVFGPLGGNLDPDSEISARWKQNLSHLEANSWLEVRRNGPEWWVSPGARLRAVMAGRAIRDVVAA